MAPDRFVQTPSERSSRNVVLSLYHFCLACLEGCIILGKIGNEHSVFLFSSLSRAWGLYSTLTKRRINRSERDYSYVASFFAFSMWVGIGATGILQLMLESMSAEGGSGVARKRSGMRFYGTVRTPDVPVAVPLLDDYRSEL